MHPRTNIFCRMMLQGQQSVTLKVSETTCEVTATKQELPSVQGVREQQEHTVTKWIMTIGQHTITAAVSKWDVLIFRLEGDDGGHLHKKLRSSSSIWLTSLQP